MTAVPSLILGTAGHIDHGKSSLIQALTGTDPDRLIEEKRRGITIELGFAQLELPSGRHLGVVDVPGHERFVRQMVAGATGVDLALIVIAADDGMMPQTVEHLAVLQLLGVRDAVVALTKTDLVDDDWVAFMTDDVRNRLTDTPFAEAPIVPVSSRTGAGLDDLRAALDAAAETAGRTKDEGALRLPVDRVFTVKGIGTVVTGTLWSGTAAPDATVEVLPSGLTARIRSVQMHGSDVAEAPAGNRVAVSLNALGTSDVRPGDFLAAPGTVEPTDRFDVRFTYLDPMGVGKPLESGTRVHVDHGTREVLGRVLFMDGTPQLRPGESAFAQIRLEEPLPVSYNDRYIVRSYSPVRVLGGGVVLSAHPRRRTTLGTAERDLLTALEAGDATAAAAAYVSREEGLTTAADVARGTGLSTAVAAEQVRALEAAGTLVRVGATGEAAPADPAESAFFARPSCVQKRLAALDRALLNFHTADPNATGIAKEALRAKAAADLAAPAFDALLATAAAQGAVVVADGLVSHPKAGASARDQELRAADALAEALEAAASTPPDIDALAAQVGVDVAVARKALAALERDGRVVRVSSTRFYAASEIDRCRTVLASFLREKGPSTAADLKDALGISRKYAMPLLEYFDSTAFTRRSGDTRTLAE